MAERKKEPHSDGPLALLHQFARDVVNRGDVVRIDRVPQPQAVGDQRRRQQQGIGVKRREGPTPGEQVRGSEDYVEPDYLGSNVVVGVIEDRRWRKGGSSLWHASRLI